MLGNTRSSDNPKLPLLGSSDDDISNSHGEEEERRWWRKWRKVLDVEEAKDQARFRY